MSVSCSTSPPDCCLDMVQRCSLACVESHSAPPNGCAWVKTDHGEDDHQLRKA